MFNCPLSREKADRLVEQLALADSCRVLDVGCGEGEFLIRVAERYQVTGVGLDSNPDCIALANKQVRVRTLDKSLSFACQDVRSFDWGTHEADLIICIGAEFILGGYRQTLQQC